MVSKLTLDQWYKLTHVCVYRAVTGGMSMSDSGIYMDPISAGLRVNIVP